MNTFIEVTTRFTCWSGAFIPSRNESSNQFIEVTITFTCWSGAFITSSNESLSTPTIKALPTTMMNALVIWGLVASSVGWRDVPR